MTNEKLKLVPYSIENGNDKRIKEIREKISMYQDEIQRYTEELRTLLEEDLERIKRDCK